MRHVQAVEQHTVLRREREGFGCANPPKPAQATVPGWTLKDSSANTGVTSLASRPLRHAPRPRWHVA